MTTKHDQKDSADADSKSDKIGTSSKTVPESDLVAMRQALEAKIKEAEGTSSATSEQLKEVTASLTKERAALAAAETKVKGFEPQLTELTELRNKYQMADTKLKQLQSQQLDQRRQALVIRGIDSEKVKTLDEAAIAVLENYLPAVKAGAFKNGYDIKGSGSADITGLSARELLRTGLDQLRRA